MIDPRPKVSDVLSHGRCARVLIERSDQNDRFNRTARTLDFAFTQNYEVIHYSEYLSHALSDAQNKYIPFCWGC